MKRLIGSFVAFVFLIGLPLFAQQDTTGAGAAGADTMGMGPADTGQMDTGTDTGGEEMPTTASPLPLVVVAGGLAVAIGLGIRLARRDS